jgi:predicted Zn-dependent protease
VEVSLEEERRFGNRAAEGFLDDLRRQGIRTTTRGREVEYLRKLVDTVRPQMQHAERYEEVRIILVRSLLTDARSFPGGTLVFFEGMLDFSDSEAALVGVIGHELSHLDRGHQLVQMKAMKLAEDGSAGGNGSFLRTGPLLMQVWSRPFRPEDEKQADLDGADWAYRAGYEPREMAKLFLRLHERNEQQLDPGDFMPGFLRAHPYERDRYEAVMQRYDELQRVEPADSLYIGRENLRRRIPRSQQEFEENS